MEAFEDDDEEIMLNLLSPTNAAIMNRVNEQATEEPDRAIECTCTVSISAVMQSKIQNTLLKIYISLGLHSQLAIMCKT